MYKWTIRVQMTILQNEKKESNIGMNFCRENISGQV